MMTMMGTIIGTAVVNETGIIHLDVVMINLRGAIASAAAAAHLHLGPRSAITAIEIVTVEVGLVLHLVVIGTLLGIGER